MAHRALLRRGFPTIVLFLICSAVATPMVVGRIAVNKPMSVIDERSYLDYVYRVTNGDLMVRRGDLVKPWVIREINCRGTNSTPPNAAACAGPDSTQHLLDAAEIDPPPYYWITSAGAAVIRGLGLSDNLLTAARLTGVFWAALAMTLLFWLSRAVGASPQGAAVAALSVVTVNLFLQQYTYVTPHASDLVVGASSAILYLKWWRGSASWVALAWIGPLSVGFKLSNILAGLMIAISLAVGVLLRRASGPSKRRALGGLAAVAGSILLSGVIWLVIRDVVSTSDVIANRPPDAKAPTTSQLFRELSVFITNWSGTETRVFSGLVLVAMLAGAIFAIRTGLGTPSDGAPDLALGYLIASVVGPIALVLSNYMVNRLYVATSYRYGLALFAVGICFAATLLKGRAALTTAIVVLLGGYITQYVFGIPAIYS